MVAQDSLSLSNLFLNLVPRLYRVQAELHPPMNYKHPWALTLPERDKAWERGYLFLAPKLS